jgi:predicted metal-binding membrane protein
MTTVAAVVTRARRRWRPPEDVALAVVVAAWLVLPAMTYHAASVTAPSAVHAAADAVLAWVVMTAAMMGPVALPAVGHVARNSLRWRRGRAVAWFAAAYGAVWLVAGVVLLTLAAIVPGGRSLRALAVSLAVAAAWQVSPLKRRALAACHRTVPLPPIGRRATLGCVRFGLRHGLACAASCWAVMAAMAVTPGAHVLVAAALTPVVAVERYALRPRKASRRTAAALGLAAAGVALLAFG